MERRLLQAAMGLGCLVPLLAGGAGMVLGPHMIGVTGPTDLDSHYRYLSGLLFGLGLGFASCIPDIETKGPRFRLLTAIVVIGGLGRALSLAVVGVPSGSMLGGLLMELVITPGLAFWQARIARRAMDRL